MPKLKLPGAALPISLAASLKDTRVIVRLVLGILLAANLVAAGFAFHLFDDSPEQLARQVQSTRQQVLAAVVKLNHTRQIAGKVEKGREEGTKFIDTYMTSRRVTYSTILNELNETAAQAHMKPKDAVIGIEAIQGTDSLDMLTVTASFEGQYQNLVKFINSLDKSKRFLIIESLTATPQQNGDVAGDPEAEHLCKGRSERMKLGAEPKKVGVFAALIAVAGIVYWMNSSSDAPPRLRPRRVRRQMRAAVTPVNAPVSRTHPARLSESAW